MCGEPPRKSLLYFRGPFLKSPFFMEIFSHRLLWLLTLLPLGFIWGQQDSAVLSPTGNNMARSGLIVEELPPKSPRPYPPVAASCDTGLTLSEGRACHQQSLRNYIAQGLFLAPQQAAQIPAGQVLAVVSVDTSGAIVRVEASKFLGDLAHIDLERRAVVKRAVEDFLLQMPPYKKPARQEGQAIPYRFGIKVPIQEESR
jgi:hypothetical protein